MRAAGAVFVVAAAAVVAGCGSNHDRRDAVNRYFDRVDAVQQPMRVEGAPIAKALTGFSTVHNSKGEMLALVHAQTVLERVRARVQRVQPPADAVPLHAALVRLYGLQVGVVSELVAMTRFVPRYDAALEPLKPAHTTLASDLTKAKGWQKLSNAFEQYRLSLVGVHSQLGQLSPPPTLRPAYEAERAALARSVGLCTSIEAALAKHDAKATASGIQTLAGSGTQNAVERAQRDQIAAAKAYNARLARISSLTAKIGRERDKLVGELG